MRELFPDVHKDPLPRSKCWVHGEPLGPAWSERAEQRARLFPLLIASVPVAFILGVLAGVWWL